MTAVARVSKRYWIWAAGWLALAALVQWPIHDRALVPMDEGHLAAAADWMLGGKLLYREIHTGIFPGIYLITSALFGLFGRDMIVTRMAAVAMNAVIVLCLWALGLRMLRPHWATLAPALYLCLVIVGFPVLCMFNYSTLAACFGLLGLLALLRYLDFGRRRDAIWLGLCVACAALTKQNFGALVFIALLLALLWNRPSSALSGRPWLGVFWPVIVSGALLTLLVMGHFALAGTLFDLIDSTLLSLGASQVQDFNNPIPPLLGPHPLEDGRFTFLYSPPSLFGYLIRGEPFLGLLPTTPLVRSLAIRASYGVPMLCLIISALLLWRARLWGGDDQRRAARSVLLFAVIFFPGIFPSAIWSHLAFVLIPILPLFGFIADRVELGLAELKTGGRGLTIAWRGLLALAMLLCTLGCVRASLDIMRWNPIPLNLERAKLRVSERQAALFHGAHEFVEGCSDVNDAIFVAPDMPAVYFLSARANPSPYDLTIPGNVDGQLIARRLEESDTRCIVFSPQMYPEFPPFTQLFPHLSRYIATHYRREKVIRGGDTEWWGLVRREDGVR